MLCGGKRTLPGFKVQTLNTSNNPLITVITVVYNGVDTLEDTMLSVLNQSYENIEYIIIDGGSTDGTLDIIRKYEDRFTYWQSENDSGIYDAMNKGIDLAQGEWINFMNSGDSFYSKDVVEKVFYKPQEADVIYGDTNLVWAIKTKMSKASIDGYMPFCHQSAFTRAYLLEKYHFNTSYKICSDKDFYLRIYKEKCSYKYEDMIISNFDMSHSFSVNNVRLSLIETNRVESKTWIRAKFYYNYHIIRTWLSRNLINRKLYSK